MTMNETRAGIFGLLFYSQAYSNQENPPQPIVINIRSQVATIGWAVPQGTFTILANCVRFEIHLVTLSQNLCIKISSIYCAIYTTRDHFWPLARTLIVHLPTNNPVSTFLKIAGQQTTYLSDIGRDFVAPPDSHVEAISACNL